MGHRAEWFIQTHLFLKKNFPVSRTPPMIRESGKCSVDRVYGWKTAIDRNVWNIINISLVMLHKIHVRSYCSWRSYFLKNNEIRYQLLLRQHKGNLCSPLAVKHSVISAVKLTSWMSFCKCYKNNNNSTTVHVNCHCSCKYLNFADSMLILIVTRMINSGSYRNL